MSQTLKQKKDEGSQNTQKEPILSSTPPTAPKAINDGSNVNRVKNLTCIILILWVKFIQQVVLDYLQCSFHLGSRVANNVVFQLKKNLICMINRNLSLAMPQPNPIRNPVHVLTIIILMPIVKILQN
ncbi:hypothetical protein CEXT_462041 [Caerostris extrusa]|uniref:Uncharacterized protein n=1 Tax=Caerostris extrusa TaxID=172846 RepID=A0AAV4MC53_CAEEX|nr:hypothetical protein CEXT_462041 [Caerostris extrusa]